MAIKDGWIQPTPPRPPGRVSVGAEAVIARAGRLTAEEIARLDVAERPRATVQLIAWDLLRSSLTVGDDYHHRLSARARAWAAVNASLATLGLDPLMDASDWRTTTGTGWGAARAARFAACALVNPKRLDPEIAEILIRPWRSIIEPSIRLD